MRLQPGDLRAQANVALCNRLQAEQSAQTRLSRESLVQFLGAMAHEHRSAAEMLSVGRLVGEEKTLVLATWLERLKDLPIPPKLPLEKRLTMGDDGLLELDLSSTFVADLSPLEGMPLGKLGLRNCPDLSDLRILTGLPLKSLGLRDSPIRDLAALRGLRLQDLDLGNMQVFDLAPLRGMRLEYLVLRGTQVSDLSALAGMPLRYLDCTDIPASDFSPIAHQSVEILFVGFTPVHDLSFLRGMPLKILHLYGCGDARGLQVLNEIKTLEELTLPEDVMNLPADELTAIEGLRTHPALRQIYFSGAVGDPIPSKEDFWKKWDTASGVQRTIR